MVTELQKRYENESPVGIAYAYSAFGIMVFDTLEQESDYDFVACYTEGKYKWEYTKHKVHFDSKDEFYIVKGNRKWYLEDALMCDLIHGFIMGYYIGRESLYKEL